MNRRVCVWQHAFTQCSAFLCQLFFGRTLFQFTLFEGRTFFRQRTALSVCSARSPAAECARSRSRPKLKTTILSTLYVIHVTYIVTPEHMVVPDTLNPTRKTCSEAQHAPALIAR